MLDRVTKRLFLFQTSDQLSQRARRALTQTLAVGADPFAGAVGQDVALVQARRLFQRNPVAAQASIDGFFERNDVDDRTRIRAPRQRARFAVDEPLQSGPAFAQVMELAPKIRQRLGVG